MRVNDAGEASAPSEPSNSFTQEILVLRKEYAPKVCRPLQEAIVFQHRRSVFLRREDINRSKAQGRRHGARDVNVHV